MNLLDVWMSKFIVDSGHEESKGLATEVKSEKRTQRLNIKLFGLFEVKAYYESVELV